MAEPCKRHTKRRVIAFRVVATEDRKYFAVGEQRECLKCGDTVVRLASVKGRGNLFGKSPREALQVYGCTQAEIDAYMAKHFPEEAARKRFTQIDPGQGTKPAMPLTSWPFPVSTRFNADGTAKGAA